jgi:SpoVK/Ycf46/Vps4 family AAA+-type ATPase
VLFIDEAYGLSGDQYGQESINTLVKEMEDTANDLVVIVAGYPTPMMEFIAQNPGLASRFKTIIEFADYTDDELVGIMETLAEKSDYDIHADAEVVVREILAATDRNFTFGNGRFVRNLLEEAIGRHAWRLRDDEDASTEDLRTLLPSDFREQPEDEPERGCGGRANRCAEQQRRGNRCRHQRGGRDDRRRWPGARRGPDHAHRRRARPGECRMTQIATAPTTISTGPAPGTPAAAGTTTSAAERRATARRHFFTAPPGVCGSSPSSPPSPA